MALYGYTWEPIKVKTEDGWTLTTFKITGKVGEEAFARDPSLNPVLLMPGQGTDSVQLLGDGHHHDVVPLPLQIYESGFEVYIANNRGTTYSQVNDNYDISEPDFWKFSWAEMGLYDAVSNVKLVKEQTGKKVNYIGFSQGTVQMFYALAKLSHTELADDLFHFAAIDPCTIQVSEGDNVYTEGLFHFEDYGIYKFGGPGWPKDNITICKEFNADICKYATIYGALPEPVSVQTNLHWAQNCVENRFQEFSPNYSQGETTTDLIDLSKLDKVPITVWSGFQDGECSNAQAQIMVDEIGERVTYFRTVPWATHLYWGGPLNKGLYKELEQRLIDPEIRQYPLDQ